MFGGSSFSSSVSAERIRIAHSRSSIYSFLLYAEDEIGRESKMVIGRGEANRVTRFPCILLEIDLRAVEIGDRSIFRAAEDVIAGFVFHS